MKLHTDPQLLLRLSRAMNAETGIEAAFVEKDYWLTTVLWELSRSPHKTIAVFKGGTSLTKAYGIIERFSEDVDLALIVQDLSNNQVKSRMDSISKAITKHVPEVAKIGVTSKGSRFRRTAHQYPAQTALSGRSQFSLEVILEINAFANPYPFEMRPITSMIADYLQAQGRDDLIQQYDLQPFSLQVLRPERTLAEKVLALARASYHKEPIEQLQFKIRHTYDLYHLLQMPEMQAFVASPEFFETLRAVQMDDAKNSEFQGVWSSEPLSGALIYQDDAALWPKLEGTYTGVFKGLVYGPLPALDDIRQTLRQLAERLQTYDNTSGKLAEGEG